MGKQVKKEILNRINKSEYFSILFDFTPDVSHQEHLTEIIKHVHIVNGEVSIEESFIDFIISHVSSNWVPGGPPPPPPPPHHHHHRHITTATATSPPPHRHRHRHSYLHPPLAQGTATATRHSPKVPPPVLPLATQP
ncbi:zinc finger MYM-type protein 1-like [Aphis craccivora]|uniref:Zinc finger MYM-type protein 1-like n=1 Tax=Aphis craccivora TaxID=307492 RepID=A0A6G0Y4W1_APHCR|nr:zinc finger MYM-type protein 1-like [Aphis craccivora]